MLDIGKAFMNPGQTYPFEASFLLPAMEVLNDPVSFTQVVLRGQFTGADESIHVTGRVDAVVNTRCARCLEPVAYPLSAPADGTFSKQTAEDDADIYPMEGYSIDLTQLVTDALLLELPMRSVCREDCKGLCPVCGGNRNLFPCTCLEGGEVTNPFSALSNLLNDENHKEV